MTWAQWVLLLIPGPWIALMWWIAKGPIDADEYCECRDCAETVARLEILLCDYSAQPFDGDQRLIDKRFDEIVRGSW
jgi:hypothetical protein